MRVCVINGSPKGKYSVTLQTVLFLRTRFAEDEFNIIHAGQLIKGLEKDMSGALAAMSDADIILFSYPVYTFIAPSQLHRFIELLKASGVDLSGKFATQITTSKHFYDVTAHRYIEDNCHDMGMRVIHGLSADMEDLLEEKGRDEALSFWKYVRFCVENGICEPEPERGTAKQPLAYTRAFAERGKTEKKAGYDTVIVADLGGDDGSLVAAIDDFCAVYPYRTRLIDISGYPFAGGCLGCFNCAGDGKCIYRDGFDGFLRESIQTASAVVYAFRVSDHSMGARFKMYDDRQFCNGHRTVTEGMPFAYLVRGNPEAENNLMTIIEARCEVGHNFLAGIGTSPETIEATAARLAYALENGYVPPRNFYGVGGMKIFRDLIWVMRGLMKADHDFYKKHGVYDFPQKQRGKMLKMKLLGALVRNPKIKAKMGNKMNEGMIAPYKKAIGETVIKTKGTEQ